MKYLNKFVYLVVVAAISSNSLAGSYEEFFRAVETDNAGAIRTLVQRGFDANSRDPKGQTGLFLALRGGSDQVAGALMEAPGVDLEATNEAGETALMIAVLKGQHEWAQRLLDRGAKVHKPGWSPVHYAATGPDAGIVKLLLDRGAPIDASSPNGSTPLMMAAQYGSEATVDLLLARGADPKRRNDRNLKASDFARLGQRAELAEKLERLAR